MASRRDGRGRGEQRIGSRPSGIKMVTPHTAVRFVRRLFAAQRFLPKPRRVWCVTCYRSPSETPAPGWATDQHVYAGQAPDAVIDFEFNRSSVPQPPDKRWCVRPRVSLTGDVLESSAT
jgi:hypothetical protein